MTLNLNVGQLIIVIAGAMVLQAGATIVAFFVFKAEVSEWRKGIESKHEESKERFDKIDRALGLSDPNEVSFVRVSEAGRLIKENYHEHKEIWDKVNDHETRIQKVERT